MDSLYMISLIVLLVFVYGARTLMNKANKLLTTNQKAELIDIFSKGNLFNYAFIILVLGLFFINMKYQYTSIETNILLYILVISVFIIWTSFTSYKKLKEAKFPDNYIKQYLLSTAIRTIGLVIFFAIIVSIKR